jgi:hypothetical protein
MMEENKHNTGNIATAIFSQRLSVRKSLQAMSTFLAVAMISTEA